MSKTTTTIETITPAIAKKLLYGNTNNRPVNPGNLAFLVKQIKSGDFHLTGETIKVANTGRLIDGQHRLMAIVESGISVKTTIVRGLEENVFKYIDTGRPRQAGDVLAIEGCGEYHLTAAAIKFIMHFKNGKYSSAAGQSAKGKEKLSNSDVIDFYHKHVTQLKNSVDFARKVKNKVIPGSQIVGLHYIFKAKDFNLAEEFFLRLGDGVNLSKTSPIHCLRERLLSDRIMKLRLSSYDKMALVIKAWNAYRGGKQISVLRFNSQKDVFPKVA